MSRRRKSLQDLRDEIDEIDRSLLALIERRTGLVEDIRKAKGDGVPTRPEREAQILRDLVERHQGPFPVGSLVRIWREIISALTQLQRPLTVAVHVPDDAPGLWDLARDHYGGVMPIKAHASAAMVIRAVSDGTASVGVLPWPHGVDATLSADPPWWPALLSAGETVPRVIARLPFADAGNARPHQDGGVVVALAGSGPTGLDRTLLALGAVEPLSRGAVQRAAEAEGLKLGFVDSFEQSDSQWLYLTEVDDFLTVDDPRLQAIVRPLGAAVERIAALGGYAAPLASGPPAGG